MHLATRFLSKAGYRQQCSFRRLDIGIFAKCSPRRSPMYSKVSFKGGLYAFLATMLIFKGRFYMCLH
jgi:hypothetical protein